MKKALGFIVCLFSLRAPAYTTAITTGEGSLTVGNNHACLFSVGNIECYGDGTQGQLAIPILDVPTQVAAGGTHTCALDRNGVECWGDNSFGQLKVPDDLDHPTELVSGAIHSCALHRGGVKCWGGNSQFQLKVPELDHPTRIVSGDEHTCAFVAGGVKCWGSNQWRQAEAPSWLQNPTQLALGNWHSCALDDNGVRCWGYNRDGELDVPPLDHPVQIVAGSWHTCALDRTGVHCWGWDRERQRQTPVMDETLRLGAGGATSCATSRLGVTCWGGSKSLIEDVKQAAVPDIRFTIPSLDDSLARLSRYVYTNRAAFLRKVAGAVARYPAKAEDPDYDRSEAWQGRLFVLNALDPVLYDIRSRLLERNVLPNYDSARKQDNSRFRVAALLDVKLSPAVFQLCLQLLRAGLEGSRDYLGAAEQTQIRETLQTIGRAMAAGPGDLAEVVKALDARAELLATILAFPRTHGYGVMILSLQDFLKRSQAK